MSLQYETDLLLEKRNSKHTDIYLTPANIKGAYWHLLDKTPPAIKQCQEYSEHPEQLKDLINDIEIFIKGDGVRKHFTEDNDKRQCIEVAIKRGKNLISFVFGMSIRDTEILHENPKFDNGNYPPQTTKRKNERKKIIEDMLYSILCCCRSDWYIEPIFEDFCSDFGYDTDSRSAFDTWQACLKQKAKLVRIFNDAEIDCLPG